MDGGLFGSGGLHLRSIEQGRHWKVQFFLGGVTDLLFGRRYTDS